METKRQTVIVFGIAVVLLLAGVGGYAAYPDKKPEQPLRIVMKNIAGNVLLDHQRHASSSGYSVPCRDCHHEMEADKRPAACGQCHTAEGEEAPKRADVFHQLCKGCHQDGGNGPVECAGCHMM